MPLVGKGAAFVLLCVVVAMLKASYNGRIMIAIGLVAFLLFLRNQGKKR